MGSVLAMAPTMVAPAGASVITMQAKWGTNGQAALVMHPREWFSTMTVHGLPPGTYDYFIAVNGKPVFGIESHMCRFTVHSAKETHTCTAQGHTQAKGWKASSAPNGFTAELDLELPRILQVVKYATFS